jgi:hypothetical protein
LPHERDAVSWKKLGELGRSRLWMLLLAEVPFAGAIEVRAWLELI